MGSNSSRQIEEQNLKEEALRKFNIRVKGYSYPHHGNYSDYIEWCRAQYQLDCVPSICHQGPNYRPQYDHYGNQIY
jgi:hypothetical protein